MTLCIHSRIKTKCTRIMPFVGGGLFGFAIKELCVRKLFVFA
jgi:hypothetical protein